MAQDEPALGSQPFRVGAVLKQSLLTTFRKILPFGGLTLLYWLCIIVLGIGMAFGSNLGSLLTTGQPALGLLDYAALAAFFVLMWLIGGAYTGAVIHETVEHLGGRRVGFLSCVRRGVAVALPVGVLMLMVGLMFVVGLVLLIVPGVILLLIYCAVLPVAAVERPGIFASLKRSAALTRGSRWRLLGLWIVVWLITAGPQVVIGVAAAIRPPEADAASASGLTMVDFVSTIYGALAYIFALVALGVAYLHLRRAHGELDEQQMAAVFE